MWWGEKERGCGLDWLAAAHGRHAFFIAGRRGERIFP
jgi:hypothetical protein